MLELNSLKSITEPKRHPVISISHISNSPKQLSFLPDVEGLRAVAILSVLLFHLRMPGFQGGFVGVDIFFVISGFLISGQLRQSLESGSFALSSFYANRIRRLGPAILATVLLTTLVSIFLLQPQMLKAFSQSAVASLFSVANVLFFLEAGYWDSDSDLKPLLHMWSLGVEEQFYLFWPMAMLLTAKLTRCNYLIVLILVFFTSLLACILYTPSNSSATFYLLPFRVWQFCLGAIVVEWWRSQRGALPLAPQLRLSGLTLCLISIFGLGDAQFPGWVALFPTVGAAMVLVSASPTTASPVLSHGLTRWIGKVSFSMYLVHWPVIALYRCYTLSELTVTDRFGLLVLIIFLTLVLHYGVETRFYQRSARVEGWRGAPRATLITATVFAAAMLHVNFFPAQYAFRDATLSPDRIEQYKQDRFQVVRALCSVKNLENQKFCAAPLHAPTLFIGNSHEADAVNALWPLVDGPARSQFVRFGSITKCAGLTQDDDWAATKTPECRSRLDRLKKSLGVIPWQRVVVGAHRVGTAESAALLNIFETIKKSNPDVQLIVFGDFIETETDCANLINQTGRSDSCKQPKNVRHFAGDSLGGNVAQRPLIAASDFYVDKVSLLCAEATLSSCATRTTDDHPMFVDRHHLTWEFAGYLGRLIAIDDPVWLRKMRSPSIESEGANIDRSLAAPD